MYFDLYYNKLHDYYKIIIIYYNYTIMGNSIKSEERHASQQASVYGYSFPNPPGWFPRSKEALPYQVYTQKKQWHQNLNNVPSRRNTLGDDYELINRIYNKTALPTVDPYEHVSRNMKKIFMLFMALFFIGIAAYFIIKYAIIPRVSSFANDNNKDNYNDNDCKL